MIMRKELKRKSANMGGNGIEKNRLFYGEM